MSPEQVLRQQTDPRSDIFSTGVVLYEMLTGRRPFAGDSVRTIIKQICSTKQKPARSIAPNLSVGIEKVIDRCLEKMPERRYQTASDLKEDLAAAMTGLQTDTMSVMKAKAAVISALDETERTPLFAEAAPDSGVTVDIRN
jgi:serine/threonine-protein kinase